MTLRLHTPSRAEFGIRQAWLADPAMMSFNVGQRIDHPGYDAATGCIAWHESEWGEFEARLMLPASRHGYFFVEEVGRGYIGHAHYRIDHEGTAHIGLNVIPPRRGEGLGLLTLHALVDRIWTTTQALVIVNEFEDARYAAARTHRRAGFLASPDRGDDGARSWRLCRPTRNETLRP